MPIIRDDGKAYRLYFATDTAVIFSLPGDYNPAGKTFSLAVRAVRDIHTPALAEATGTVSGQIVTFSVDTNTQSFADALASGISQAWLEIYVGDEDVLLQRPVSIEPRAGSLEGQPPAPVVLYYTAAQTDAAITSAIAAHNSSAEAHPGTFDAAGAATAAVSAHNNAANAHPGTFDAAGTAANEVDFHNGNAAAHDGNLLPNTASNGDIPIFSGSGWTTRPYGDKVEAVTGDFTAEPGTVYSLDLAENKTIYIEEAGASDFEFALVVTMGATLRSLTLLPDMVSAILWSDGGNPPDYNADNPAPALDTTLAVYTIRFRYIASENALHAELAATKDYNLPISGVRGVFTSSVGTMVTSAMTVSGGIIADGLDADRANVYSRGIGAEMAVSSGGMMTVFSGGVVSSPTVTAGGRMTVSGGGMASSAVVSSGAALNVLSGGAALDVSLSGGVLTVFDGGTVTYSGDSVDTIYGVEYDPSSSSPACQRVALRGGTVVNVAAFDWLPAHNFKRCVMDNLATRHIAYYLDPFDSNKKLDQTAADLTGADGDVMVEIPVVHWRVDELENGHVRWLVSDHAFDGSEVHPFFKVSPDGNTVRTQYVGAYQATICDANGARIANMMDESASSPTAYNAAYKLRSVAGCKPYTNTTLANMRTNAHNNGGQVANALFYQFLGLMMMIEGASLDTQSTISEGFAFASAWNYAFTRLSGRTNAGNGTAETEADATLDAAITWQNHAKHVIGFQYRGIENPYGQVWQFEEGFQKWNDVTWNYIVVNSVQYDRDATLDNGNNRAWTNANSETVWTTTLYPQSADTYSDNTCTTKTGYKNTSLNGEVQHDGEYWWTAATDLYTSTDQHTAASPTYTRVAHDWPKEGYAKTFNYRSFYPTSVGGGASTYMCDYFYNSEANITTRAGLRGGSLYNGATVGAWSVNVYNGLGSVNAYYGCRLSA